MKFSLKAGYIRVAIENGEMYAEQERRTPPNNIQARELRNTAIERGLNLVADYNTATYSIAPNGKPSLLNEADHALVRTDAFKEWAGDWEGTAKREALASMQSPKVAHKKLVGLHGKTLRTEAQKLHTAQRTQSFTLLDGRKIAITARGWKEVKMHSADERVPHIAAKLQSLLGRSIHLWSEANNDPKYPNVTQFHNYGVRATVNNKDSYIRFVIREDNNGQIHYDHDATSVELLDAQRKSEGAPNSPTQKPSPGESPASLAKNRMLQWWHSVNPSSVTIERDANGEPTASEVARFKQETGREGGSSYSIAPAAFYSQLERTVEAKVPNAASVEQIKAVITNQQNRVKQEELKWSGVLTWLDEQKGNVRKEDLLQYLKTEGRVRFEEVTDKRKYIDLTARGDFENYRTTILTLPDAGSVDRSGWGIFITEGKDAGQFVDDPDRNERMVFATREEAQEIVDDMDGVEVRPIQQSRPQYTSSHFPDIPNYVAHMRTNEREDSAGERGKFVEEIQSDRHQKGRKKGYEGESQSEEAIPDAPFRKDWSLQLFKRALRDAVERDLSWVGWTDGETQAKRYPEDEKTAKGMAGFYDDILLNEIGRYVKQWGGKVTESSLITERQPIKFWKVEITPEMRESVKTQGQASYSIALKTRAAYERRIDALLEGASPRFGKGARVLDRADILDLLGHGGKPLYLVESAVGKKRKHGNIAHPAMTAEQWKKVPDWIENPVAAFTSATENKRIVLFAPELVDGKPVLIVLEPNGSMGGLDAHVLVNAYEKDKPRKVPIQDWVKNGKLLYLDKEKSPRFAKRSRLQLPGMLAIQGEDKILTEADLVNYRRERAYQTFSIAPAKFADLESAMKQLDNDPAFRRERVAATLRKMKRIKHQFENKPEAFGNIEAIAQMEAIIGLLPPAVRAKVGGYRKLSTYKTERGRVNYLKTRIAKTVNPCSLIYKPIASALAPPGVSPPRNNTNSLDQSTHTLNTHANH